MAKKRRASLLRIPPPVATYQTVVLDALHASVPAEIQIRFRGELVMQWSGPISPGDGIILLVAGTKTGVEAGKKA